MKPLDVASAEFGASTLWEAATHAEVLVDLDPRAVSWSMMVP